MYYLRTKPATNAIQFTLDKSALKAKKGFSGDSTPDMNGSFGSPFANGNGEPNGRDDLRRSLLEKVAACSLENGAECTMCSS